LKNKVILSSVAYKELDDSSTWYAAQSEKLPLLFLRLIDESIEKILSNPEAYPKKYKDYREFVLSKFPYIIVYEYIKEERVVFILHIFHTGRNPKLKFRKNSR
jgi:plasmid stabilization system protein ParE